MDMQSLLDWYVHLAKQPGWKAYVWHRVNELAEQFPVMYRELPALLTKEMQREHNLPDRGD